MTEDLLQMIKQGSPENVVPSKHIEDLVSAVEKKEVKVEAPRVIPQPFEFPLITLYDWFTENSSKIQSLRFPKASMLDVDPKDNLIVTVPKVRGKKDTTTTANRKVRVIEECSSKQVINLPSISVDVFDHDIFRIIYQCDDHGMFIKSYCLKNGLINVFCLAVVDQLIPYGRDRLKRGSKTVKVPLPDFINISEKLKQPADIQKIHLLYKQVEKQMESIKTNFEAISWLNSRQEGVIDVNHLLQLDDTIIYIINN